MCVVGAIIGAGVIGAAGTAVAGSEAAGATNRAAKGAISEQQLMLGAQERMSAPYRQLGTDAIGKLEALLGLRKGGNASALAALRGTPGYQFARDQGLTDVTNRASAMGLGLSGNTLEGLQRFGTGLADQTYQQTIGNLTNTVGLGQAAAAGQAANLGQAGTNISNALLGQGNTLAGIDANTIAGITKSIGGGLDNYATLNTLRGLGGGDLGLANVYGPDATLGALNSSGAGTVAPLVT